MRYKLTIAYDGAQFHGWQEQNPPDAAPLRTVQGVVREALTQVARQPVEVIGASRTDTGVHAVGQVAHFDAELSIPIERLPLALNSRLPGDVEIRGAEAVADDFDAIGGARNKQYRYRIWNAAQRPLGLRHQVYHCWLKLDLQEMNDAASRLVGEHDFEGLTNAGHGRSSTVRTIYDCRVEAHPLGQSPALTPTTADAGPADHSNVLKNIRMISGEDHGGDAPAEGRLEPGSAGRELHVVVSGNGFLYNMVRIIVGTLIEVGRGHRPPGYVDELLAHADRQQAGPTTPPNGLCLEWIRY